MPHGFLSMLALIGLLIGLAPAQSTDDATPPSLDDLLGLDEDEDDRDAAEAARRDAKDALDRELAGKQITDALELALRKMTLSADLLEEKLDPGLGTQRVQEEILAKLDELIDQASQQQQMMNSQSSSSRRRESRQQQQQPQQPQRQQSDQQRNPNAKESRATDPPPRRDGDINKIIDENRSEWGRLPPRVREALLQGRNGVMSSLYRDLTEAYYTRLAEEDS